MHPAHSSRPLQVPRIDNQLKGKLILIVEDDPGCTDIMKDILQQHGARTLIVSNAPAAFPLINSRCFDLITTGMQMPGGINGLEFIRHLKARSGFKTPIIMCTARGHKEVIEQAFAAGAAAYIVKPFEPSVMITTVRTALQLPPSRVRPFLIHRARRILDNYAQQRATPFLRKKFLVIEDDQPVQYVLQILLSNAGAKVQTAASGEAALEILKNERFDLIMTGIVMPGRIDGLELLRRLTALPGFKTPVIILSGNDTREVREKSRALGAAAHLAKPFDNDELVLTLRNALDRSGGPRRRLASFWKHFRQDGSHQFLRYLERREAKKTTRPHFNTINLSAIRSKLANKTILIITSALEISEWLQRSLETAGADVWTASDTAMTSTLAEELKLDLVLVDLEMKDWSIMKATLLKLMARPGFKASIVTIGPRELKNGTGHGSVIDSSGHIRLHCRPQDLIESLKRVMKRT